MAPWCQNIRRFIVARNLFYELYFIKCICWLIARICIVWATWNDWRSPYCPSSQAQKPQDVLDNGQWQPLALSNRPSISRRTQIHYPKRCGILASDDVQCPKNRSHLLPVPDRGDSQAAVRSANVYGVLRCQWDNRKYGARKLRFPHAEAFLPKLSDIWARAFKMFASPVRGRESWIIKRFKGRQIINPLGAPTCLGQTLVTTRNLGTRRI